MQDEVRTALELDDTRLDDDWRALQRELNTRFGSEVGVEGILFLIGVQESGRGFQPRLKKEDKQELIMEGTYHVLHAVGVYALVDRDEGGPQWERRVALPDLTLDEQEKLLRVGIIRYFAGERPLPPREGLW